MPTKPSTNEVEIWEPVRIEIDSESTTAAGYPVMYRGIIRLYPGGSSSAAGVVKTGMLKTPVAAWRECIFVLEKCVKETKAEIRRVQP